MSHVKLTLSCPQALADRLTEHLLESEWSDGFTTLLGGGHGADFAAATLREKVRGQVDVMLVMLVLPSAHVTPLLDSLRAQLRAPHVRYWIEPVHAFGDLS